MDVSNLSAEELKALRKKVDRELESRKEQQKKKALMEIQRIAEEAGISLDEVTGGKRGKTRASAKVKYRDPENASNTWAGRGRKPNWLDEKLRQGRNLEDFAV